MARDIPGFYYDEVRRRYFKIQPDHLAPRGSKYSRGAIRQAKDSLNVPKTSESKEPARSPDIPTAVRRATVLTQHEYALSIGNRQRFQYDCPGRIWAQSLSIIENPLHPLYFQSWEPPFQSNQRGTKITSVCWDAQERCLLVGTGGCGLCESRDEDDDFESECSCQPNVGIFPLLPDGTFSSVPDTAVPTQRGQAVRSINVIPGSTRFCFANGWFNVYKFPSLVQRSDPDDDRAGIESATLNVDGPDKSDWFGIRITDVKLRPETGDRLEAAVGTEKHGIFISYENESRSTWNRKRAAFNPGSAVFSVDWLDRNIVLGACRNGRIVACDRRAVGSAMMLQHEGSPRRVVALDQHRVLVAGTENKMRMYDLRYSGARSSNIEDRRTTSTEYVGYEGFRNQTRDLALAVSKKLGVVASAQENSLLHRDVMLHDLWTGKKIEVDEKAAKEPISEQSRILSHPRVQQELEKAYWWNPPTRDHSSDSREVTREPIQALCFVDDVVQTRNSSLGPALFVARNHTVETWNWR